MRSFVLLSIILASGPAKASVLQSTLPPYNNTADITLYDHERFRSSVPEHNIIPPHGNKVNDKYIYHLNQCAGFENYTVCGESNFLGTDLNVTLYRSEKPIAKKTLEGKFTDGFFRLLGAPSVRIYTSIYFKEDKIGLLTSFGFTLINRGSFCETVVLAPNDEFSFGLTKNNQVVLIGLGRMENGAERVDGWRLYDEKVLCP